MPNFTRLAVLPALLSLVGCDALNPFSGDCAGGKCDSPSGNGSIVTTANGNLNLYSGYSTLFDKAASQCVKVDQEIATGTQVNVGSTARSFELAYVSSREELAREMGLDLGLKVKYMAQSGDLGVNLLHKFKSSANTVSLLLKVEQDYMVRNRHPLLLTTAAVGKLAGGAKKFASTCGTTYVNGLRYGGQMFLLLSYEADSHETALELKTSLGVMAGLGPVDVDADLKARLSEAATQAGVRATLRVVSRGFELSGTQASSGAIQDFLGASFTPQTLAKIDELRVAMQASLELDACRDAGDGDCGSEKAPGYFDNKRRRAQVTGVEVGFYDTLANVDDTTAFEEIADRLTIVERFVRDWAELEERMAAVYYGEIDPFLAADQSRKAGFNVAPPGQARRDPTALRDLGNQWMDRFFPEIGTQIGSTYETASNQVTDCWSRAAVDLFHQCAPADAKADTTEAWRGVLGELEAYQAGGRVLPLDYKIAAQATVRDSAAQQCAELSTGPVTWRLPTEAEAQLLAPLVGFGAITWKGDAANQIWIDHSSPGQLCSDPNKPNPFFRNRPGDTLASFGCADADGTFSATQLTVLCVPSGGPVALPEAP